MFISDTLIYCLDVIHNLLMFTFLKAEIKAFRGQNGSLYCNPITIDLYEQYLIALFGQSCLLNHQEGRKHISNIPNPSDRTAFQRPCTSVFDKCGNFPTNEMNIAVMD